MRAKCGQRHCAPIPPASGAHSGHTVKIQFRNKTLPLSERTQQTHPSGWAVVAAGWIACCRFGFRALLRHCRPLNALRRCHGRSGWPQKCPPTSQPRVCMCTFGMRFGVCASNSCRRAGRQRWALNPHPIAHVEVVRAHFYVCPAFAARAVSLCDAL